jgi:hypothetical protein
MSSSNGRRSLRPNSIIQDWSEPNLAKRFRENPQARLIPFIIYGHELRLEHGRGIQTTAGLDEGR